MYTGIHPVLLGKEHFYPKIEDTKATTDEVTTKSSMLLRPEISLEGKRNAGLKIAFFINGNPHLNSTNAMTD
jgi:hypothetical protein